MSNIEKSNKLAGSGEVLRIRKLSQGPVGFGTTFEADGSITIAGQTIEFVATSVVVTYDPPNTISWIPVPPLPTRRIQWWYHLSPEGQGTRVTQEVEVAMGEQTDPQLVSLKENYQTIKAPDIEAGMAKTLENLRRMVEK